MQELENERLNIVKRSKILKFITFLQTFLLFFISFVFCKDIFIALFISAFNGYLFFNFFNKKINSSSLEFKILDIFLQNQNIKFQKSNLKKILFDTLEFKSQNMFISDDFILYDVLFLDEYKRYFCGIMLKINKKFKTNENEDIFLKLKNNDFNINIFYTKDEFCFIPSLKNPFNIDLNLSVEKNLNNMQNNLKKIQEFIDIECSERSF